MKFANLIFRLTLWHWVETLRHPTYVVTTLVFPAMFFWFFGVPNIKDSSSAQLLMGSFSAFAVLGVVLFQMTVGIAQDRSSSWNSYLRTLPVPSSAFLLSKLMSSMSMALFAVLGVVVTAHMSTTVDLPSHRWVPFFLVVLIGGVPFAAMGIILGLLTTPKSAVPVANLFYLPFSFAGGLWIPPNGLSKFVQDFSEYLPTRCYGELVWASTLGDSFKSQFVRGHVIYSLIFLLIAFLLYRRDEGLRFG